MCQKGGYLYQIILAYLPIKMFYAFTMVDYSNHSVKMST